MKKLLVLAGHLDDSIIAVGGIIRKFINQGGQASVVCFGNGDEAFTTLADRDSCVAKFKAEAIKAHRVLGVDDFQCFDLPDFAVQENRQTYRQCIEAIRRVQPDVILGHYWLEYFQHRAMARLTCDSWWQAGWACSADLGKPWATPAMYHFEVLQTCLNRRISSTSPTRSKQSSKHGSNLFPRRTISTRCLFSSKLGLDSTAVKLA